MESMVVFFPCINIDETYEFYTEIIGLKLHQDQGACKIFDTGYGYIGFCQYDTFMLSIGNCISFNLKDNNAVDMMYEKMSSLGVHLLSKPAMHPKFPVYSFFMNDCNGYKLEFQKIQNM